MSAADALDLSRKKIYSDVRATLPLFSPVSTAHRCAPQRLRTLESARALGIVKLFLFFVLSFKTGDNRHDSLEVPLALAGRWDNTARRGAREGGKAVTAPGTDTIADASS